jgi:RNA polymerase sigma-70 factor (ECF subfamily)
MKPDAVEGEPPPAPCIEELLAHGPFLERLARSLVADEQIARDLVQDTWVAALERPPRHGRNPRAWLGRVLRRGASRDASRRRGDDPRAVSAAEIEPADPRAPGDEQDLAALCVEVSAAVRALEPSYRTVILLRFYDGLAPSAIATRLDVPVSTVHTRLQRALATLRARLDREVGRRNWAGILFALPGLRRSARPQRRAVPLRSAGLTTAAVFGAALGLSLALFGGEPEGTAAPVARSARAATGLEAALAEPEAIERAPARADRVDAAPGSPGPPTIELQVVTPAGRPDAGAAVQALVYSGEGASLATLGFTDADGRFAFRVTPALVRPPEDVPFGGRVGVYAVSRTRTPSDLSFVAPAIGALTLEVGEPGVLLRGSVHDAGGVPVAGALVVVGDNGRTEKRGDVLRFSLARSAASEADGSYQVHQVPPGSHPVYVSAPGYAPARTWWSGSTAEPVAFALTRGATVAGTVLDANGHPVPGAEVWTTFDAGPERRSSTRADDRGVYALAALPPRDSVVFARSPEHPDRIASTLLDLDEGAVSAWSPRLEPASTLELELVDERGDPLAEWHVELVDASGIWNQRLVTDASGTARFDAVPAGPLEVYTRGALLAAGAGSARCVLRGVERGPDVVRVVVPAAEASARLRGRLVDGYGMPHRDASISLRRAGDVTAHASRVDRESGTFETAPITPGRYQLSALFPPLGRAELGTVSLAAGEELDLGSLATPRLGRLAFTGGALPGDRVDVSYVTFGKAWVVRVVHEPSDEAIELMSGEVKLTLRRGARSFVRRMQVEPDELVVADLDRMIAEPVASERN